MSTPSLLELQRDGQPRLADLAGKRVLVSGIDSPEGEAIVEAFARQGVRLVIHASEGGTAASRLADRATRSAMSVRLFSGEIGADAAAIERLANAAVGAFDGLDIVVNQISARPGSNRHAAAMEAEVGRQLHMARTISELAAEQAVALGRPLVVVHASALAAGPGAGSFAAYALLKVGLEDLTAAQARAWGGDGLRFNAIVPGLPEPGAEEPDEETAAAAAARLAALALYAASSRGRWMSGTTFAVSD